MRQIAAGPQSTKWTLNCPISPESHPNCQGIGRAIWDMFLEANGRARTKAYNKIVILPAGANTTVDRLDDGYLAMWLCLFWPILMISSCCLDDLLTWSCSKSHSNSSGALQIAAWMPQFNSITSLKDLAVELVSEPAFSSESTETTTAPSSEY